VIRRALILCALLIAAAATPAFAHEHTVLGTVTHVTGDRVTMKTIQGKEVAVTVTKSTRITRGKETVKADAIKDGIRIVVTTASDEAPYAAKLIQLGTAPEPAPQHR